MSLSQAQPASSPSPSLCSLPTVSVTCERPPPVPPYAYRCPPGAFDAVAWYDAWLRGASLRGQPADSDDSDSADDTYNDFDDPRSRAQLVTRWLHQVLSTDFEHGLTTEEVT